MNRKLLCVAALLVLLLSNCKKDSYDYKMYSPALSDVDSIYLSATDKMLIADGQAKLKFIVEAFRLVKLPSGKDSMEKIILDQLPANSIKIIEERSGTEVGMEYSTSTLPYDTVKFHAVIGDKQSTTKAVALRAKPGLPQKLYVDVIFHVWELNTTHPTYDVSSYQPVTYEMLQTAIQNINSAINNKLSSSPNGASANIEFRLATKNQNGATMIQPGFNKVVYSDNVKVNPLATTFNPNDFTNYINTNKATLIWKPKEFLNIHVLPYGSNTSMGTARATKQLAPQPGEELIPGVAGIAANEDDFVTDYVNTVCGMPRTLFFPGFERKIEIFQFIGEFYGLYVPTYRANITNSDYCYDTREYNTSNQSNYVNALKIGVDNEKYVADNVMDDSRYPSLLNSITLDQVNRMRSVLARCPGRMNAKTQ
ncbi:hypothetical protein [Pseudobacter ginsenosidimutans]|uniref:Pregnancy-associated plasma protein-A n=1 Tax=Pseudobacter ginsenosidimutans TaxID=661488 RepID=A0A4Q7N4Z9_9BACT|nr:hypothetical protein [Pseudobacter ginsenosidimutans]QEC44611.1 hypothetical protein FSB84_24105 [Pseudobacter ginsenosidimutans]RZS76089.1 hypothetical protein EV199_1966 [Pseudobacter ginsenosidimutans]